MTTQIESHPSTDTTLQITPSRGRPRDPERMRKVIATASAQFGTLGYERTSIDAISKLSGVSKVTIYKYFPSKKKLFEAYVSSRIDSLFEDESMQSHDPLTPRFVLHQIATKLNELQHDEIAIGTYRSLISMANSPEPELRELCSIFFELGPIRVVNTVAAYLAAAHAAQSLCIEDVYRAADEFLALFHGFQFIKILLGLDNSTLADNLALIDRNVDIFMQRYQVIRSLDAKKGI